LAPFEGNLISQEDWTTDVNPEVVHVDARFNDVSPDYFRTMEIPILQGREFLPSDGAGSRRVVILNQTMARRLFGAANPVGHFLRKKTGEPFLIVGLARDSKYSSLNEENTSAYYQSYFQVAGSPSMQTTDQTDLHFLIRAARSASSVIVPVNKLLSQLDPSAALNIKLMRENLRDAMGPSRISAAVLGAMGLLGLFLASAGLYGVLLFAVSRRTREIGIRVALGATRGQITRLVAGESAILAGAGIVIGLALAAFAVRPLSMFLIAGIHPSDAVNFITVAALLCLVAALATISPILRALRSDPVIALRQE
jgi:ABC-type antimicrobial peptide transport system permease subunit